MRSGECFACWRKSVCEVAGKIDLPTPTGDDEDAPEYRAINRVTKELQSKALHDDLKQAGLKFEAGLFTGSADKPPRSVFFTYYMREKS